MPTCTFISGGALSGSVRHADASLLQPVAKPQDLSAIREPSQAVRSLSRPLAAISVNTGTAWLQCSMLTHN